MVEEYEELKATGFFDHYERATGKAKKKDKYGFSDLVAEAQKDKENGLHEVGEEMTWLGWRRQESTNYTELCFDF